MNIVVLGGGLSSERQVSLVTSQSVCCALRLLGHKAVFVDMYFGLEDYSGSLEDVFDVEGGFCKEISIGPNVIDIESIKKARRDNSCGRLGKNVLEICKLADIVYLGLHGSDGEDGQIQAVFDMLEIRYTGSGSLGSALGMNKDLTKLIMQYNNIPTPPYVTSSPCVVKEVDGGSSIGTWVCKTDDEMRTAVEKTGKRYIMERLIEGREFSVPVLGERALDVIEIIAPDGNFDYVSKYQQGNDRAIEICPANITNEEKELMQELAVRLHRSLGLRVYSRSDFILDKNGKAWCLEVNTLPGMTPSSLFPKAAACSGMSYPELCEKIIELSLE